MSTRPPPQPTGTAAATTPNTKPSTSRPTPSTSTSKPTPSTTPKAAAAAATPRPRSPETHLSFNTRNLAASILQSYEQLAWYALARNESLPQTRLHFQSILSGFTPADRSSSAGPPHTTSTSTSTSSTPQDPHWQTDTTPHNPSNYFHEHCAAAGLEVPLGGEGRRKCSSTGTASTSGKGKERERERGSLGRGDLGGGHGSPRNSLGGEGSGRKKRKSVGGGGGVRG